MTTSPVSPSAASQLSFGRRRARLALVSVMVALVASVTSAQTVNDFVGQFEVPYSTTTYINATDGSGSEAFGEWTFAGSFVAGDGNPLTDFTQAGSSGQTSLHVASGTDGSGEANTLLSITASEAGLVTFDLQQAQITVVGDGAARAGWRVNGVDAYVFTLPAPGYRSLDPLDPNQVAADINATSGVVGSHLLGVGDTLTFFALSNGGTGADNSYTTSAFIAVYNFTFTPTAIPEPASTTALVGALVLGGVVCGRRRRAVGQGAQEVGRV